MKTKLTPPTEQHLKLREAIIEAIRKAEVDLPAIEILAVISYTVGQILAMQDQRSTTSAMATEIVILNIDAGNADAIDNLSRTVGGVQ